MFKMPEFTNFSIGVIFKWTKFNYTKFKKTSNKIKETGNDIKLTGDDINVFDEILNLHYELARTQMILDWILRHNRNTLKIPININTDELDEKALLFIQEKFPNIDIRKKQLHKN